jgi:DinB superfamily
MPGRDDALRQHLSRALGWGEAHLTFEDAVAGIPVRLRGNRARGFAHSPWELLEHIRLAQRDLLEFCTNPDYAAGEWPDDYWPKSPAPPSAASWKRSADAVGADRKSLESFIARVPDLMAAIPQGKGKTYLRSILLVLDHTSYHVGQLVMARKLLSARPR